MIKKDITIYKGNDFVSEPFEIRDKYGSLQDPELWGVQAQIRVSDDASSELIASFTVLHEEVEPGWKVFRLSLSDVQTRAVSQKAGYYDVLVVSPDGVDSTEVKGKITFLNIVTDKNAG